MASLILAILLFANPLLPQAPAADQPGGPAPDVPELANLSRFVGSWNSQFEARPIPGISEGGSRKGAARGEWILEGRFLRQEWTVEAAGTEPRISGLSMMTYDPMKRAYRMWGFSSTGGGPSEGEGTYDEHTKTFHWTARDTNGIITTTQASFAKDGEENWTIVVKDGDGRVLADLTGKNTKRAN